MNVEPLSPYVTQPLSVSARSDNFYPDSTPARSGFPQESKVSQAKNTVSLLDVNTLKRVIAEELHSEINVAKQIVEPLASRIAAEVDRICNKSGRIQMSGQMQSWQLSLARHRLQKCLTYYQLGSRQGRIELHSTLGSMVYRHIAPSRMQFGFQARYNLIEDFLQGFYSESLKAFRRENELPDSYQPRTRLELAEYMAFSEQYGKRRISLPGSNTQQLIVLRAQRFSKRQPLEVSVDIEQALESPKGEEAEAQQRSPITQQLREQMVANAVDTSSETALRDRVISELIAYLEEQEQSDCIDYLVLKLQDLSAPEIDELLGLSPRQRDYLQQRFKYHVEKFALSKNWRLVHQWLGADLDQNLGLSTEQWQQFLSQLSPEQHALLRLKQAQTTDQDIARQLKWTLKQVQKRWTQLLDLARNVRNQAS